MTTRTHARFTAADLGALLAIEQAGAVLANEAGATISRMARLTVPKTTGTWVAEFLIWGPGSFASSVSIGIATSASSLATYVGGDATSWGYRAGDGAVHNNGAATDTGLASCADGDIVIVELRLEDDPQRIAWYKNGTLVLDKSLGTSPGSGATWHLAASLAGTNDADLRAFCNSGQRSFQYTSGKGWFDRGAALPQIRLSTGDYMSASNDSPASTHYAPVIGESGLSFGQRIGFWPFSGSAQQSAGFAEVTVFDPDGEYDTLINDDWRDVEVWIQRVEKGQPLSTAERVATGVVERVEMREPGVKSLILRDSIAALERPLQNRLYLPNAPSGLANTPYPVALGAVRNYPPDLVDETAHRYRFADAPVESMGEVRVQGVVLDPQAGTPEYTLTDDRAQVELLNEATGKVTVEVSSLGTASGAGQADLLGGDADPFSNDGSGDPAGFDSFAAKHSDGTAATGDEPYYYGGGAAGFPQEYLVSSYMRHTSAQLTSGKTYKIEYKWVHAPPGSLRPEFIIYAGNNPNWPGTFRRNIFDDEAVSTTFTANQSGDVWLYYNGNNFTGIISQLAYCRIYELPDAFAAAALQGLQLEQYLDQILTVRAELPQSEWSEADAQAIDAATGYEIGFLAQQPVTIRQALFAAADSWSLSFWGDESGVVRATRIEPPEDTADGNLDWEISDVEINDVRAVRPDAAAGLTTAMQARRNWSPYSPTDFQDTSTAEVNNAARAALQRGYQETVTSAQDLPGMYEHARLADPVETLLDDPDDAQAELDRVVAIYASPRWIYTVEVNEPAGTLYQIGQVGRITCADAGVPNGKKVLVIGVDHDFVEQTAELTLWG